MSDDLKFKHPFTCIVSGPNGSGKSAFCIRFLQNLDSLCKKGKAVPLQAWSGPEGSRKLSFPDFLTTAQYGGKVASRTHRSPIPPGNTPGTHFC
jgi:pantothenate kinase-related protein Tda10